MAQQQRGSGGRHLRRWGAMYLVLGLFAGSWVGQFIAQAIELQQEARQHRQEFQWSEFWAPFFSATFENWQSEWLQLFTQGVVLLGMKHLIFKADAEDMEKTNAKLDHLLTAAGLDPRKIERDVKANE